MFSRSHSFGFLFYRTVMILITKCKNDFENIKHFAIEENDEFLISINHGVFNSQNLYKVTLKHMEMSMSISLQNFLEHNQNSIKFLKYQSDKEFNNFKVKLIGNEIFEIIPKLAAY